MEDRPYLSEYADEYVQGMYTKHRRPLRAGDIVEDCNYVPCLVLKVDVENDNVDLLSLLNSPSKPESMLHRLSSCSLRHCGLNKIHRARLTEYLSVLPYQRHILEREDLVRKDENWMGWFGDRLPAFKAWIEAADFIRKRLKPTRPEGNPHRLT